MPRRHASLREVQGEPGRPARPVLRTVPGPAREAGADTGPGRGSARERRGEGAAGGGGNDEGRARGDEPVMSEAFTVELTAFEGPFRTLAELILDHKVDVCDVPISSVTDRFLRAARDADGWDLAEATWFLSICAVLLEMKVARLMPKPEELRDEDLLGGSPDLAYARSIELAAFRRVSALFTGMLEESGRYSNREAGPPEEFADLYPDLMERVT